MWYLVFGSWMKLWYLDRIVVFAIWIILQFSETWGGGQWPDLALAGGGAQYECGEYWDDKTKDKVKCRDIKICLLSWNMRRWGRRGISLPLEPTPSRSSNQPTLGLSKFQKSKKAKSHKTCHSPSKAWHPIHNSCWFQRNDLPSISCQTVSSF